jgi:hypothetical protein
MNFVQSRDTKRKKKTNAVSAGNNQQKSLARRHGAGLEAMRALFPVSSVSVGRSANRKRKIP